MLFYEAGNVIPPVLFFLEIGLAAWALLWFQTNFRIFFFFSVSVENAIGILIGIAVNL